MPARKRLLTAPEKLERQAASIRRRASKQVAAAAAHKRKRIRWKTSGLVPYATPCTPAMHQCLRAWNQLISDMHDAIDQAIKEDKRLDGKSVRHQVADWLAEMTAIDKTMVHVGGYINESLPLPQLIVHIRRKLISLAQERASQRLAEQQGYR